MKALLPRLLAAAALAGLSTAWPAALEIHPAGPTVPENLLRIELRFAQAQRLPFDVRRLQLLREDGREIENALLDLALPSADGRRITILMDPGRVKTGVGPQLDAGRALHAGQTVRLRVDDPATAEVAVKTWQVTAAVSRPLDAAAWRLSEPRSGSREPLVVDLRAPISSSGEGLIAVVDAAGRRVPGKAVLGDGDTVWHFTPSRRWRSGRYRLVAHPDLEDPAGNRHCSAFEQFRASTVRCDAGASRDFFPSGAGP